MSDPIELIIDTDPGQDDAAAILMAFGLEKLGRVRVRAITAVAGNVPLPLTQKNARIICDWAHRGDVPVYAGACEPLTKPLLTAEEVHGKNGLEGTDLHDPETPLQTQHAAVFLSEYLSSVAPKSVTLCPIGPLTNIALALKLNPNIVSGIREIVIMGGTFFEPGNVTPRADFNFFVDPVAAQIVLESKAPIKIIPLDTTHQARLNPSRMEALRNLKNENGTRVADILQSYVRFDIEHFGLEGGPLHDPCAIACAVFPEWFTSKSVHVSVETQTTSSEGASIVDWHGVLGKEANALWTYGINDDAFFEGFTHAIASLP